MEAKKRLIEIYNEVQKCEKCPLYKNRTKPVFGNGSPDSPIMLIGEGPGYEEDKTGKVFVGKSGILLDKILDACCFDRRKHIFIANIVKCRPLGNRNPEKEEIEHCMPYLLEQIKLINPIIIVTLGSVAVKSLIDPSIKITKQRGQWIKWSDYLVMPTYHPSALLRNPDLKKDAWIDFKNVVLKYRELGNSKHHCSYI